MFTNEQINEIEAMCERATSGPWEVVTEYMTEPGYEQFIKRQAVTTASELIEEDGEEPHTVKYSIARMDWSNPITANAELIAAARTLLPQLAAEHRKAMEVVSAAQKAIANATDTLKNVNGSFAIECWNIKPEDMDVLVKALRAAGLEG